MIGRGLGICVAWHLGLKPDFQIRIPLRLMNAVLKRSGSHVQRPDLKDEARSPMSRLDQNSTSKAHNWTQARHEKPSKTHLT